MTAPTRELVKSLYRDSVGIWGAKLVGLNTGSDRDVNEKFFIVSTPEGYLSAVRSGKEWAKAGLLIVDEAHYLADGDRGGDLDVAITTFTMFGGKALLISGTFPNHREVAQLLKANLFVSRFVRTRVICEEIHAPDDFSAKEAPQSGRDGAQATCSGFVYNRQSIRLRRLKAVLKEHEAESVLVFVPTKAIGFCLEESLTAPFHCADIEAKTKDRLVEEFREGTIKTLIATNTLSEGVNTPADVVVIFGTRRGQHYLDSTAVRQAFGRAGRGKDVAKVYLLCDKIELFNAKKEALSRTLPLPVESMALTMLSLRPCSLADITEALGRTYAASLVEASAVRESVERQLRFLDACNLLRDRGVLSLTKEGHLLARYLISPKAYMGYITAARKLAGVEDTVIPPLDKGCMLLSLLLPMGYARDCPAKLAKDMLMRLIPLEFEGAIEPKKAGLLRHYVQKPSIIPVYFQYQLREVDRWLSMFTDLEKYGVHAECPGKAYVCTALTALKQAAVRAVGHRPKQCRLLDGGDAPGEAAAVR
jgi:replicative superfamily II helicase